MARNQEKAQAMLNKFLTYKASLTAKPAERRPHLASMVDTLSEAEKWRKTLIKEISKKVAEIQNGERKKKQTTKEARRKERKKGRKEERRRRLQACVCTIDVALVLDVSIVSEVFVLVGIMHFSIIFPRMHFSQSIIPLLCMCISCAFVLVRVFLVFCATFLMVFPVFLL